MIKFLGKLPKKCVLAVSGGVDSIAIASFLLNSKRDVELAFFHHGTLTSENAQEFVTSFASSRHVKLHVGHISNVERGSRSKEEFWREERLDYFRTFDRPVLTAHHLDDAIETWIFTSLHGEGRLIPYKNGNIIHPFLITRKSELIEWCIFHDEKWVEDVTNEDTSFMRNLIRKEIVPNALKVNPGLHKTIKKKYIELEKRLIT